jgi:Lipocalin-like domain
MVIFPTNIIRPGRPKFTSNNRMTGTPEENKEAVAGNVSNFGSYAINSDGSITLEITGRSVPNRDGTKQKRLAEIKGVK